MTGIFESIKKELKEWYYVATSKTNGDIAHEMMEELDDPEKILIERFYIRKSGKYEPVEIRDRLKHSKTIVKIQTGCYSRDKTIANIVFELIINDERLKNE